MEGQNAAAGDGCAREMTLYVCWGDFLEEGVGGSYVTMGRGKIVYG